MAININKEKIGTCQTLVTYLEMHTPPAEILVPADNVKITLLEKPIDVEVYREHYYKVGEKHYWLDRLVMPDDELHGLINADNIDIFIVSIDGAPAGYAEFIKGEEFTEILYFGLYPEFTGKGYGKYFLRWAIEKAWSYGPKWIQLNTCKLDHPYALTNYKNNGFTEVRSEYQTRRILID